MIIMVRVTVVSQIRVGSRSYQLEIWKGTGFTGPGSLERGQRPYLAAAMQPSCVMTEQGLGLAQAGLVHSPLVLHHVPSGSG